jgi:hypothetical protein
MAWDQAAPSSQIARSYTYRFFIDGKQSALTDVRCSDSRSAAGYECSGQLPPMAAGHHTLEVAAVSGGVQGPTSVPLLVRMGGAISPEDASAQTSGAYWPSPSSGSTSMCAPSTADCYDARLVARSSGTISELLLAPDGRAFFIENSDQIRVVQGDALRPEPALRREIEGERFVSLAMPPDFAQSHLVFVAWSESAGQGRELLSVTRYREVEGTLGEGATIVNSLPIPAGASAPMAVDEGGLLYVALPASESAPLLRFDSSGSVPSSNPSFSPVVGIGYASPFALAWDANSRQVWLAGADTRLPAAVRTLSVSTDGRIGQTMTPALVFPDTIDGQLASSPAMALAARGARSGRLWLVPEPGHLYQGDVGSAAVTLTRVSFDALGVVLRIAAGLNGDLLVVTTTADPSSGSAVWRLVPTTSRRVQSSRMTREP